MKNALTILGVVSVLALPGVAFAQGGGAAAGAATGAVGGAIVGGPVGAAVGAVGGAIVGGIADADRREFRTYVETQRVEPYRMNGDIVVGATLPTSGVKYYEVPARFKVQNYRYTVVNGKTVLVDPRSHRVVEIIE